MRGWERRTLIVKQWLMPIYFWSHYFPQPGWESIFCKRKREWCMTDRPTDREMANTVWSPGVKLGTNWWSSDTAAAGQSRQLMRLCRNKTSCWKRWQLLGVFVGMDQTGCLPLMKRCFCFIRHFSSVQTAESFSCSAFSFVIPKRSDLDFLTGYYSYCILVLDDTQAVLQNNCLMLPHTPRNLRST